MLTCDICGDIIQIGSKCDHCRIKYPKATAMQSERCPTKAQQRMLDYQATIATRQEFTTLDPPTSRPLEATADGMALMHDAGLSIHHGESIDWSEYDSSIEDDPDDGSNPSPDLKPCSECNCSDVCRCGMCDQFGTTHPSIRSCDKCGLTEYCNCSRDEDRDTADWQEYDRWSKRIDDMIDEFNEPEDTPRIEYNGFNRPSNY